MRGRIDSAAIDFVRRVNKDLLLWHEDWKGIHVEKLGQTHVLLEIWMRSYITLSFGALVSLFEAVIGKSYRWIKESWLSRQRMRL